MGCAGDVLTILVLISALPASSSQACTGTMLDTMTSTPEPQNITSPDYPSNYSSSQDCHWKLIAPTAGERVCLRVVSLNIEGTDPNCSRADYLRFYDGAEHPAFKMAEMCGSNHDGTELCSGTVNKQDAGNFLSLHFHSDSSLARPGFLLQFWTRTTPLTAFYSTSAQPIISTLETATSNANGKSSNISDRTTNYAATVRIDIASSTVLPVTIGPDLKIGRNSANAVRPAGYALLHLYIFHISFIRVNAFFT